MEYCATQATAQGILWFIGHTGPKDPEMWQYDSSDIAHSGTATAGASNEQYYFLSISLWSLKRVIVIPIYLEISYRCQIAVVPFGLSTQPVYDSSE